MPSRAGIHPLLGNKAMTTKHKTPDHLLPHCIYLMTYCPIMICITKEVAESVARELYKEGTYLVGLATAEDIKYICES